jgi:hypothetical protein
MPFGRWQRIVQHRQLAVPQATAIMLPAFSSFARAVTTCRGLQHVARTEPTTRLPAAQAFRVTCLHPCPGARKGSLYLTPWPSCSHAPAPAAATPQVRWSGGCGGGHGVCHHPAGQHHHLVQGPLPDPGQGGHREGGGWRQLASWPVLCLLPELVSLAQGGSRAPALAGWLARYLCWCMLSAMICDVLGISSDACISCDAAHCIRCEAVHTHTHFNTSCCLRLSLAGPAHPHPRRSWRS